MGTPKDTACTPSPASLAKVSYGGKPRITPTLTKWLSRDMWTPGQAAMPACCLCPYPECGGIPAKGIGVLTVLNVFR